MTKAWSAGVYWWQAYVYKGTPPTFTDKETVETGQIEILADLTQVGTQTDLRSTWKQILDNLEAAYLALSTKGYSSISANGRTWSKERLPDLIDAINHAKSQVEIEEAKDRMDRGLGTNRKITMKFVTPQ